MKIRTEHENSTNLLIGVFTAKYASNDYNLLYNNRMILFPERDELVL